MFGNLFSDTWYCDMVDCLFMKIMKFSLFVSSLFGINLILRKLLSRLSFVVGKDKFKLGMSLQVHISSRSMYLKRRVTLPDKWRRT